MSKAAKMDEKEAHAVMAHLAKFVDEHSYELVNDGTAATKRIIDSVMQVLCNKYQTRHGLSGDDCKITFDPSARMQILMIMRIFYVSIHANTLEADAKVETYAKNFDLQSIEFQFWTWFAGIVKSSDQAWDELQLNEIPKEIEAISLIYSKRELKEGDDVCVLDTYQLAQVCFVVFVDAMVDKIANLYWDPSETGTSTKGTVIKGAHLSGIFRVMNTAAANPEIFIRLFGASNAFTIVKKQWIELSKVEKKKVKDEKAASKAANDKDKPKTGKRAPKKK